MSGNDNLTIKSGSMIITAHKTDTPHILIESGYNYVKITGLLDVVSFFEIMKKINEWMEKN